MNNCRIAQDHNCENGDFLLFSVPDFGKINYLYQIVYNTGLTLDAVEIFDPKSTNFVDHCDHVITELQEHGFHSEARMFAEKANLSYPVITVNQVQSDMFVCFGFKSLLNICGHTTMGPACRSGTLTNVLPHRNAMPQTQDMTPHPITLYRHGAYVAVLSVDVERHTGIHSYPF